MTEYLASIVGDSGLNGWATFLVYLVTAALCLLDARRSAALAEIGRRRVAIARSRRGFWLVLATLLVLLGLLRQLDLQALAANMGWTELVGEASYSQRSGLQQGLVAAIGAFGTIGLLIALFGIRRAEARLLAAMAGAASLVIFTLVRANSLDTVDRPLQQDAFIPHAQISNLIEIGALVLIAAAAFGFARQLHDESEVARLRGVKIQERRRQLGEKRRAARS